MRLLPPSPKPSGVFAEKSEVPLATGEVDLLIAQELERQIQMASWVQYISDTFERIKENRLYVSPYPVEYIYITFEVKDEQPDR